MFRSHDHPQTAYIVPCWNFNVKHSVNYFIMLTLVLWQHVVLLCVSRTVFRVSLVMVVRRVLCSVRLIMLVIRNGWVKTLQLLFYWSCVLISNTALYVLASDSMALFWKLLRVILCADSGVVTGKVGVDYLRATSLSGAASLRESLRFLSIIIIRKKTVSPIILSLLHKIIVGRVAQFV